MKRLPQLPKVRKVRIIGAPYSYGKGEATLNSAPRVLRKAGLPKVLTIAGIQHEDRGDIQTEAPKAAQPEDPRLKYLPEVLAVIKLLTAEVKAALTAKTIPIVLGGDHSVAIGSLLGLAAAKIDTTVIWIDTHGDFHTSKTTLSGRLHGMALALGLGLDKQFKTYFDSGTRFFDKGKAILFGAHKFDPGEKAAVEEHISLIDMLYIIRHGIGEAVEKLLSQITTEHVHISLDLDAIDKHYAPGTDMAINGALTYRELIYTLEKLAEKHTLSSMDVVELAPENDVDGKTTSLALESITTALGHRVGAYEMYMEALDPHGK